MIYPPFTHDPITDWEPILDESVISRFIQNEPLPRVNRRVKTRAARDIRHRKSKEGRCEGPSDYWLRVNVTLAVRFCPSCSNAAVPSSCVALVALRVTL